jgi:hypothetical protein
VRMIIAAAMVAAPTNVVSAAAHRGDDSNNSAHTHSSTRSFPSNANRTTDANGSHRYQGMIMADTSAAVKSVLALGEEKMGEVVKQLLANDAFVAAVQQTLAGTLEAKRNVDKGVSTLLGFANIPSVEDYDQVKGRLDELEALLGTIQGRLASLDERLAAKEPEPAKKTRAKKS